MPEPAHRPPSEPCGIVTFGRRWSRGEYARFLVLDAGLSVGEAAREAGLSHKAATRAAGPVPPAHAVEALYPGTAPFLHPALRAEQGRAAATRALSRHETTARRLRAALDEATTA